jgi:hypothetical protein
MPQGEQCTISVSTMSHPRASSNHPIEVPYRESDRIREREVDIGSFTEQCTSSPSSSWSKGQHGWHVRKPRGHPHSSLPNTQGTCRRQSSCGLPHPVRCGQPRIRNRHLQDDSSDKILGRDVLTCSGVTGF